MLAFRTVYVVDDDPAERRRLSNWLLNSALEPRPLQESEFLDEASLLAPGCAVIEIFPGQTPRFEALDAATQQNTVLPPVATCEHCTTGLAVKALKHGALDVYDKLRPLNELVHMVHSALQLLPDLVNDQRTMTASVASIMALSQREFQVLWFVCQGLLSKQIGHELGISPRTVEMHRRSVLRRLKVASIWEAVHMLQRVDGQRDIVARKSAFLD